MARTRRPRVPPASGIAPGKGLGGVSLPEGRMTPSDGEARGRRPAVIRRLRESDVAALRTLRLAALSADPMAFGSTHAREAAFDEAKWTDRVRQGATSTDGATWVAEADGVGLVGMIVALLQDHAVHVFGMWVDPSYRGQGLGGRLLDVLLEWAAVRAPASPVVLSVNPTQLSAVRLYLGRGFRPTGVVEPIGHTPGVVVHEMRRSG
jgi:ribosomal protein S18 acetylase RimI-like enzyme